MEHYSGRDGQRPMYATVVTPPQDTSHAHHCSSGFVGSKKATRLQNSRDISEALGHHTCHVPIPNDAEREAASDSYHCRRTLVAGAADSICTLASGLVFVIYMVAMTLMVVYSLQVNAELSKRVSVLEKRLAELDEACGGERTCADRTLMGQVERRQNKFAFLMTQTRRTFTNKDSRYDEEKPEKKNSVLESSTPDMHPIERIRFEEAKVTRAPPRTHTKVPAPAIGDAGASLKRMPAISQDSLRARRGARRKDKEGDRVRSSSEAVRKGRTSLSRGSNSTSTSSTEIVGVHFQANLNRTTTIGVAGWIPHWTLSSSILAMGSPELTAEIKSEFRLSSRGNVTVRTPGLYYVYSQMMYYDPNEYIGHSIVVDGVESFTCIAPIGSRTNKYKTCFIGGLIYIPARAKVGIKMLYTPRQVCLFEDTSYFGMFRVN